MGTPKGKRMGAKMVGEVFARGVSVSGTHVAVRTLTTSEPGGRIAVVVPKSVAARATERNRLRRIVRAALIGVIPSIKRGARAVCVVKRKPLPPFAPLRRELLVLLKKADILNE